MYTVSQGDRPRELTTLPQSSVGAPCPTLIAEEHGLRLAYYLEHCPDDRGKEDACLVVKFHAPYAHMFGPPNDEAFSGHPLASRGLAPYRVFEIENSSWLKCLERMNSVHPYHRPERYAEYKHFVFAFHDSAFECIAKDFECHEERGFVWSALKRAQDET
jgi:hypothetical protein